MDRKAGGSPENGFAQRIRSLLFKDRTMATHPNAPSPSGPNIPPFPAALHSAHTRQVRNDGLPRMVENVKNNVPLYLEFRIKTYQSIVCSVWAKLQNIQPLITCFQMLLPQSYIRYNQHNSCV